jgi:hypothetical protein
MKNTLFIQYQLSTMTSSFANTDLLERIKKLEEENKSLKENKPILHPVPKKVIDKKEQERLNKKKEILRKKRLASGYNLINPNIKRFKPRGIIYEYQIEEERQAELKRQEEQERLQKEQKELKRLEDMRKQEEELEIQEKELRRKREAFRQQYENEDFLSQPETHEEKQQEIQRYDDLLSQCEGDE